MERHLIGLIFFVLSLFFGFYISPLWFQGTAIGTGKLADKDVSLKFYPHISSHFVMVYYSFACYGCADRLQEASEDFHKELETAVETIEIGSKFNEQGIVVGERAVARFFHEETQEYFYVLLWTDEDGLHRATSSSLQHVLDFEKYPQRRY